MAYTPPNYLLVDVDLYKAGGFTIPIYTSVDVDLSISDEVVGDLLLAFDEFEDSSLGLFTLKKAIEIVVLVSIDDEDVTEPVLINRPAILIELDDEEVPPFLIESYIKNIEIYSIEDEDTNDPFTLTHYIRTYEFPSIDDEEIGESLFSHFNRSFDYPTIDDEFFEDDLVLLARYSNINIMNFMMLLG